MDLVSRHAIGQTQTKNNGPSLLWVSLYPRGNKQRVDMCWFLLFDEVTRIVKDIKMKHQAVL